MTTHTHIFQPLMGFAFLDTQNALCQLFQLPKSILSRPENLSYPP